MNVRRDFDGRQGRYVLEYGKDTCPYLRRLAPSVFLLYRPSEEMGDGARYHEGGQAPFVLL